ncbi:disaggregatase related repeat-containing protein [Methanosarcina mazei]|nr:disaggregatase related repeat-containing protein [Methanosarcina mazei]
MPTALCKTPTAPIVYVAGDGSGDFNCDGKGDEVQINQALKFVAENSAYTTVHLKGPFTYTINSTIYIQGSNTILEGDSDAVVKLVNHAGWETMVPLIGSKGSISNVTVRGFEINANHNGNTELSKGKGYYNCIYFGRVKNISVYDMYMHDGHGDGLRTYYCENIQFYNNKIYLLGHDGLYAIESDNVEAWNNRITCRINSALRVWNSNNVKFHDNFIDSYPDAGPGIQVQRSADVMNVEIYDNLITNTYGPGIWVIGTEGAYDKTLTSCYIHHNIFNGTGTNKNIQWVGGVLGSGFHNVLIENNVFEGVHNAAVVNMYMTYDNAGPSGSGFTTTIRNNIIANTTPRLTWNVREGQGTGYGILNCLPKSHNMVVEYNCVYNSAAGDYKNVNHPTDINVDPLFVDSKNGDYHLKSQTGRWTGSAWVKDSVSSPCIDAGNPSSDYSKEPEDNGNRANIGRYGNTIHASLSGVGPEPIPEVYDNRLREASPDTVYQDSTFIDVGGMNDARYRDVMWFDLSGYDETAEVSTEVTGATLSLYWYYPAGNERPDDTVIEVYRPASEWNSSYVNWNKKDKNVAWKNAGGDWYDKNGITQGDTPYASIALKGSELPDNKYHEIDVTELVNEYVSGKYENTGFLIKARNENNNYIAFYSNECGKETQKPSLNITKKVSSENIPVVPEIIEKITLNATLTGAIDNRLREASPDAVYQDSTFIDVGGMNNAVYRDIMWFDLNEFNNATEVTSANLSLYWYYPAENSRLNDTVIEVYKPASSWNSSYVSWNNRDKNVAWKNPGGDWYDKNGVSQGDTPYASITLKGSELPDNKYHEIDVTELVNEYVSGNYANTGFLIKARDENNNYVAFYSNNCGNETQVPKLQLEYIN